MILGASGMINRNITPSAIGVMGGLGNEARM